MKQKINVLKACSIVILFLFNTGCWKVKKPSPEMLMGVSPEKAIELANEWSEQKLKIKSYVNSREVSFIFPDKRKASVPLDSKLMYIAIGPYINKTHT